MLVLTSHQCLTKHCNKLTLQPSTGTPRSAGAWIVGSCMVPILKQTTPAKYWCPVMYFLLKSDMLAVKTGTKRSSREKWAFLPFGPLPKHGRCSGHSSRERLNENPTPVTIHMFVSFALDVVLKGCYSLQCVSAHQQHTPHPYWYMT